MDSIQRKSSVVKFIIITCVNVVTRHSSFLLWLLTVNSWSGMCDIYYVFRISYRMNVYAFFFTRACIFRIFSFSLSHIEYD